MIPTSVPSVNMQGMTGSCTYSPLVDLACGESPEIMQARVEKLPQMEDMDFKKSHSLAESVRVAC